MGLWCTNCSSLTTPSLSSLPREVLSRVSSQHSSVVVHVAVALPNPQLTLSHFTAFACLMPSPRQAYRCPPLPLLPSSHQCLPRQMLQQDSEGASECGRTVRVHLLDALCCVRSSAHLVAKSVVLEIQNHDVAWPSTQLISRQSVSSAPSPHSTYSHSMFGSSTLASRTAGVTGLSNFGNTCFMNSAIQCLSNTKPLTEYFLSSRYKDDINYDNPLGTKGRLVESYARLINNMWRTPAPLCESPVDLKHVISSFAPQFSGYQQHDSQELTSFLLDGLHEDLNRVKKKEYVPASDVVYATDEEAAMVAWDSHTKRNNSIVMDIFQGQFKSTVTCPECSKVSVTFDPFMSVSVPVPETKDKKAPILFFPSDGSVPIEIEVAFTSRGHIKDFRVAAIELISQLQRNEMNGDNGDQRSRDIHYVLCDVFNSKVFRILTDTDRLSSIGRSDLLQMHEIELPSGVTPRWVAVQQKEESTGRPTAIAHPFVVHIASNSGKEVHAQVRTHVRRILEAIQAETSEQPYKLITQTTSYTPKDKVVEDSDELVNLGPHETLQLTWAAKALATNAQQVASLKDPLQDRVQEKVTQLTEETHTLTLKDCLDRFTKEERLGEEDTWFCPQCKEHRRAKLKMELWKLPSHFIVHLKRFMSDKYTRDKIASMIEVPLGDFDFSPYTRGPLENSTIYRLYAVSNHSGGLYGGHYTAHALNARDGKWYTFNDTSCREMDEGQVITSSAYVLYFQRQEQQ